MPRRRYFAHPPPEVGWFRKSVRFQSGIALVDRHQQQRYWGLVNDQPQVPHRRFRKFFLS